MSKTAVKNAVAVTPGGSVTPDMIAGYVTMFTIPDQPLPSLRVLRTFAKHDLDTNLLPPARREGDVFASACRSVETTGGKTTSAAHKLVVTVDAVMDDPSAIVYQIGRRVVDRSARVVEHEKAMRVTYDKTADAANPGDGMLFEPLDPAHYAALAPLEDEIRAHFAKHTSTVPGYKVRGVLRTYMGVMGATNLRGKAGGVYFVPARHKETIDGLTEALADLYGEDADLYTIPLVNDEGAREMVRKHFTVNAVGQVEELMAKLAEALTGTRQRAIRKDFITGVVERRREIATLRNEYSALLKTELHDLGSKIEDLDEQIEALALEAAKES